MVLCGGCKFWDKESWAVNDPEWGECLKLSASSSDIDIDTIAEAICHSEGIGAELITKKQFGCVCGEEPRTEEEKIKKGES